MDLSPGPSLRSCAHGCISPVRPIAAAATAPVGSSHSARGVPPVPPRAAPDIVVLDDEEPELSSSYCARVAVLVHTAASVFAFAVSASAGTADPAAPHNPGRR